MNVVSLRIRCFAGLLCVSVIPDSPTLSKVAAVGDASLEEMPAELLAFFSARPPRQWTGLEQGKRVLPK